MNLDPLQSDEQQPYPEIPVDESDVGRTGSFLLHNNKTVDAAPVEQSAELPSLNDFLAQPDQAPSLDEFMAQSKYKKMSVFGAFRAGATKAELSQEQRDSISGSGLWNTVKAFGYSYVKDVQENMFLTPEETDYIKNTLDVKKYKDDETNIHNALMDGFIVPAAKELFDTVAYPVARLGKAMFVTEMGAIGAGITGASEEAQRVFETTFVGKGLEKAGMQVNIPAAVEYGMTSGMATGISGFHSISPVVAKAKASGLLENENVYRGGATTEAQAKSIKEASDMLDRTPPAPPPTVHEVARRIDPETFNVYDELRTRQEQLRNWYSRFRDERQAQAELESPFAADLAKEQARFETGSPKNRKVYQARVDDLTAKHDAWVEESLKTETPDMAGTREKLQEIDYQLQDIAKTGKIADAYREAEKQVPKIEEVPVEQLFIPEVAKAPESVAPKSEKPAKAIKEREHIVEAEKKKWLAAGRTVDEANAIAQLVASRYETRAALFEGKKGTAKQLYYKDSADVRLVKPDDVALAEQKKIAVEERAKRTQELEDRKAAERIRREEEKSSNFPMAQAAIQDAKRSAKRSEKPVPPKKQGEMTIGVLTKKKKEKAGFMPIQNFLKRHGFKVNKSGEIRGGIDTFPISEFNNEMVDYGLVSPKEGYAVDVPWLEEQLSMERAGKGVMSEAQREAAAKADEIDYIQNTIARELPEKDITEMTAKEVNNFMDEYSRKLYEEETKNISQLEDFDIPLFQKAKGKIDLSTENTKAVISLFEGRADASTVIHESGHKFFDEMLKDAKDPDVPAQLKADVEELKKWAKFSDKEPTTKAEKRAWTRAHEKIARGFERYLMEGVAPSKALARVFEKFKTWLTGIYKTVADLRVPLTPEVRAVFDRMISMPSKEAIIAAEPKGKMMADVHVADAMEAKSEQAASVADTIRSEIDATVEQLKPEFANALKPTAEVTGVVEKAPSPERTGAGAEPVAARPGVTEEPAKVAAGGGGVEAKGGGLRVEPAAGWEIDKAGNIRLDNLNRPEDVKQFFRDIAEKNDDFMDVRTTVLTDIERGKLAAAVGLDPKKFNPKKPDNVSGPVWTDSVQRGTIAALDAAKKAADAFKKNGSEANLIAYLDAEENFLAIAKYFSSLTEEWGQTGRVFNKADMQFSKNVAASIQDKTGQTLFQIQKRAKIMSELETAEQRAQFLRDSQKPTFLDMVTEFRINAMLSGFKTHVKNILGNTFTAVNSVVETAGASVVGKIFRSEERVALNEVEARLFGIFQGAQDGLAVASRILKGEVEIQGAHTVEKYRPSIPGKLGKIIRIPTKFLSAEDEIFKAIGFRQELNALAYRQAKMEGKTGEAFKNRVADLVMLPTEEMMIAAKESAEYQTFTNPLGKVGQSLQNMANSNFVVKMIFPFVRTPINIVKYAGERTPFGLLSKEIRDNLSGVNGTVARDTQIARVAIGTSLSLLAMKMTLDGSLTDGGTTNPEKRRFMMAEGWRPYSVKIGDIYYSYEWFDPFATIMGTSADMTEILRSGVADEEEVSKIVTSGVAAISKNISSKMSLRGISDLTLMISDPDRYGERYFASLAASFIPSAIGQPAIVLDPVQRDARNFIDTLKAKIPYVRETLTPKTDVWGEEIQTQNSLGVDIVSPIYESRLKNDPVNMALMKLGMYPARPDRTIRGVELTDVQFSEYAKTSGRLAKMRLNSLIEQQGFQGMTPGLQRKMIAKIISSSRDNARNLMLMQYPEILQKALDTKKEEIYGTR